jgi:hypothetical protein
MPGAHLQHRHNDLSISCKSVVPDQSLYPDPEEVDPEKMKQNLGVTEMSEGKGVPIFIMLPLDTVRLNRCRS